uniref:Replication protein A subunit n=1 Tax=Steinernema glaseri TaxID=37863 RepID=A0A1I7ZWA9_9BILA
MSVCCRIDLLTPYISKWKIYGVVTDKKRTLNSLSFSITDKGARQIRVVAFGNIAQLLDGFIDERQMYYITSEGSKVVPADRRYNTTGAPYEIRINSRQAVSLCSDMPTINPPQLAINATSLDRISSLGKGALVDVLAVVHMAEEASEISMKNGRKILKRNVHLIDKSNTPVHVTLWRDEASKFDVRPNDHPVIAIKNGLVDEYQGIYCLKFQGKTTKWHLNPDSKEAEELAEWFAMENPVFTSPKAKQRELLTIGMAESDQHYGTYINIVAQIQRADAILYKACANQKCRKKVSEINGQYHCEKCGVTCSTFKYDLFMNCDIFDATGCNTVTIFGKEVEKLLCTTAEQLALVQEEGYERYESEIQKRCTDSIYYRTFNFRICAKNCWGWDVSSVEPVNFKEYRTILKNTVRQLQL